MPKKTTIWIMAALISFAFILAVASAYPQNISKARAQDNLQDRVQIHDELRTVLEQGTYQDLVDLREKYDHDFKPWIENEADFEQAKAIHEKMEQYRNENGYNMGQGHGQRMGNRGQGMRLGCPML